MANTYTPTYNLIKPEVGADTNTWGTHLNTDLDTIDANMVSRTLTSAQTLAGSINLPSNGLNVGSGQLRVNSGNVSMTGALAVTGATSLSSTLAVTGNSTVGGTLAVTGNTTLTGTLGVSGATTLALNGLNVGSGQLNCTGGGVSTNGNLSVTGTSAFTGNAAFTTLSASGAVSLSSTLAVTGNTTLSGTLSVTGASSFTGNLLIVSGTSERTISVGSSGGYFFGNASNAGWRNSGGTALVYWDMSGNFTAYQNITAYSDARLKKNVETISNATKIVNALRGVFYERIEDDRPSVGVIAQEIREVLPQVVNENDGMLSVAYGNIVGVLIEAIKEMDNRIKTLEVK